LDCEIALAAFLVENHPPQIHPEAAPYPEQEENGDRPESRNQTPPEADCA
jgi:hypothetical protein